MTTNRRQFLEQLVAGTAPVFFGGCAGRRIGDRVQPPNIVLIVADDLGYGDLSCYGAPDANTSNIDRLARQGVKFTDFHMNCPVCTPSRVAMLTGRYQQRTGLDRVIKHYENDERGLSLDEVLLPELLREQGYATGIVGKWHLGRGKRLEYMPTRRGFDYFYGHPGGTIDYWRHTDQGGEDALYRNVNKVQEEGYTTDLFGRESVSFINRHADIPFFLYVAFNAPHTPMQVPDRPEEKLEDLMNPAVLPDRRDRYVKMVERMDQRIGDILDTLDDCRVSDNTLVIFTSDNGAPGCGRNAPLNGYKCFALEGGHRVPLLARWPGRIPEGSVYGGLCAGMDIFTTVLKVTGSRTPHDRPIDGVDLSPYLTGKSDANAHDWLAWRFHNIDGLFDRRGYRKGPWKLRIHVGKTASGDLPPVQLYNLDDDIGETRDLSRERPDKLKELLHDLARWEREMGLESIHEDGAIS
jgi:arylsulfatase A